MWGTSTKDICIWIVGEDCVEGGCEGGGARWSWCGEVAVTVAGEG